jgi:hypothetical protein
MFQRIIPVFSLCLLFLSSCVTSGGYGYMQPVYIYPGVGLGTIVAVVISWSRNRSILWAIIHGILGWIYVIYVLLVGKNNT